MSCCNRRACDGMHAPEPTATADCAQCCDANHKCLPRWRSRGAQNNACLGMSHEGGGQEEFWPITYGCWMSEVSTELHAHSCCRTRDALILVIYAIMRGFANPLQSHRIYVSCVTVSNNRAPLLAKSQSIDFFHGLKHW